MPKTGARVFAGAEKSGVAETGDHKGGSLTALPGRRCFALDDLFASQRAGTIHILLRLHAGERFSVVTQ